MGTLLAERIAELRNDRRHGGSWLARRSVETLLEVASEPAASTDELLWRLRGAARELAESRPGVGAVEGALGRLLATAHRHGHLEIDEVRRLLNDEAAALLASRTRAGASIAIQLSERLRDAFVLTHSASATVREALVHTPPELVICTTSEPQGEGRSFADELRDAGLNVDLVEDEEAPEQLSRASLLLLGADTVFRDGTLCNKVGTQRLAEAAEQEQVPTFVACEVIKLAPFDAEASALAAEAGQLVDFTPPTLIDAVVTEEGTFPPDEIAALVDQTSFLREGYQLVRSTA